ncbi:hypothetical protein HZB94_00375 [Candidatus Falkowbacteria bacterium]|nr:hypothetical protein [Candidatus Falkowbacteria bacterium]
MANLFLVKNQPLSIILGLIFLFYFGQQLGRLLFPTFDGFFQFVFGVFSLVSANSIILWLAFYFYRIDDIVFGLALAASAIIVEIMHSRSDVSAFEKTTACWLKIKKYCRTNTLIAPWGLGWATERQSEQEKTKLNETANLPPQNFLPNFWLQKVGLRSKPSLYILAFTLIYLALSSLNFYFLFRARTDEAIASPWNILPTHFFIIFFIATIFLLLIIRFNKNNSLPLILIIIHAFQLSSVALIVYKIGYGFDPFIHLAAMKNILADGALLPKTFYYIGEYSLIIFLAKLLGVGLGFINKALLPLLFSVFLPTTIYYSFADGLNWTKRNALIAALAALFLPVAYFINTTPQGLTNLLAIMIIFLSLLYRQNKILIQYLLFLSLVALTIHPLYGAPITLYVLYVFLRARPVRRSIKIAAIAAIGLIGAIIFPLLFIFNSLVNKFNVALSAPSALAFPQLFFFKKQFNFAFDLLYVYGFNYRIIFIGLAVAGFLFVCLRKKHRDYAHFIVIAAILFLNFFIVKNFLNFEFATEQNKLDYLDRIVELALYFLLPVFLYLISAFSDGHSRKFVENVFFVLVMSMAITASLYFSYPVKDNYKNSHSFNVSQADVDTVQFIEQRTNGDYIVLANQMVGAAAIREFDFKKYYHGQFYYSIPTGGANFYQYFNKMIFEKPAREHVKAAMDMAGVKNAYFVVNDYWTNSRKIIAAAKQNADEWFSIAGGRNIVFYYKQ